MQDLVAPHSISLKQGRDVEYIKSMINRALLSLPQSKRIKFLSQTAILEFKCGVPEEGRSRFELLLRDYPKRTDLWSVYIDQEVRLGDMDVTRALFDRVTCLASSILLSTNTCIKFSERYFVMHLQFLSVLDSKLVNSVLHPFIVAIYFYVAEIDGLHGRFLFKKYLAYEKSQGDRERMELVMQKATEYAKISQA